MTPDEFKRIRSMVLGLTQVELAQRLRTTRMTITRYEGGTRRIPGVIEVALAQLAVLSPAHPARHLTRPPRTYSNPNRFFSRGTRLVPGASSRLPMAGVVAAGSPIEAIPQTEFVEVPPAMSKGKDHFVLKVKGDSMRDEGILPGDLVVMRRQATVRNGQTVVGLLNREATLKKYYRRARRIELHPANATMEPIIVGPEDEFQIQGVLVGVIRYCDS